MNVLSIVYDSPAHFDFGGNGFQNLLLDDFRSGYTVSTLVITKAGVDGSYKLKDTINKLGFTMLASPELRLSSHSAFDENVEQSVHWLLGHLKETQYDIIYIERICAFSQIALVKLGLDYIVIGSDGSKWGFQKSHLLGNKVLKPLKNSTINPEMAKACDTFKVDVKYWYIRESFWALSPLNNIHFMPTGWFLKQESTNFKAESRFAGLAVDNARGRENKENFKRILITFGNSMPAKVKKIILEEIKNIVAIDKKVDFTILTGEQGTTDLLANDPSLKGCTIKTWSSYEVEFSNSDIAIGHGGTAHIYNCIKYSTIPICFPALADQFFNANRVEELGIGFSFFKYSKYRKFLQIRSNFRNLSNHCIYKLLSDEICLKQARHKLLNLVES